MALNCQKPGFSIISVINKVRMASKIHKVMERLIECDDLRGKIDGQ